MFACQSCIGRQLHNPKPTCVLSSPFFLEAHNDFFYFHLSYVVHVFIMLMLKYQNANTYWHFNIYEHDHFMLSCAGHEKGL